MSAVRPAVPVVHGAPEYLSRAGTFDGLKGSRSGRENGEARVVAEG